MVRANNVADVALLRFVATTTRSNHEYSANGDGMDCCSMALSLFLFVLERNTTVIAAHTLSFIFTYYVLGLRYEDILSRDEPEVNEALELAHPDVVEGRYRRLKRASDLAFKQKILYDYAPDIQLDPFKEEITSDVQKILSRDIEYDLLNNHKKG
jgi:hypothetical protein